MDPQDREKIAFTIPLELFEFERMPYGLCNAPETFKWLMQQCLSGQVTDSLLVSLDNIIIYSSDFSSHMQHLEMVFERLQKHGLKLRMDKCKLLQQEVKFLGHMVDCSGVHSFIKTRLRHNLCSENLAIPIYCRPGESIFRISRLL